MKLSVFRHMNILSGVRVGVGSLVYANTLPVPKSDFFTNGRWSGLADWKTELEPFYATALKMLGAAKNPRLFHGDLALQNLAKEMERTSFFKPTKVSVFSGTLAKRFPILILMERGQ